MAVSAIQEDPYVILYGIPWDTYEEILDALGEYHLRHAYSRGTLEMRGLLYGVSWKDYEAFLNATRSHSVRHTYRKGLLEIMSPLKDHDWVNSLIGRMIEAMTLDLDIDIQSIGSTTVTGKKVEWGLQPDEAYYVANEGRVRGKKSYDPQSDPPPDLVIEVDVTHSSIERLSGFATLEIPEVWRHDGEKLHFLKRTPAGRYREVAKSLAFPWLAPLDFERSLEQASSVRETEVIRNFVKSARKLYRQYKAQAES